MINIREQKNIIIILCTVFRADRTVPYVADYAFKKAKIINDTDAINKEEERNYDFLRKYIHYCKRFFPTLSKEAEVMIAQYYVNIMTRPESHESPRLFDTLTSLCFAVARLKQKDIIDIEDVKEVIEFYNLQLHHLSELATIPRDPRDLVYEGIVSALKGSSFGHEFVELVRTVSKTNVFVREYIGEDLQVRTNRKLRDIRDRLVKVEDKRILIRKYSPLTVAWKDSYKGGDVPAYDDIGGDNHDDSHNNKTGQEESTGKGPESDTSDTSDSDKKCNGEENEPEVGPGRIQVPSITNDKEVKSHVTHITQVTPTQKDTTTSLSYASGLIIIPLNGLILPSTAVALQQGINSDTSSQSTSSSSSSSSNPLSLRTMFKQLENSVVQITSKPPNPQSPNTSTSGSGFV